MTKTLVFTLERLDFIQKMPECVTLPVVIPMKRVLAVSGWAIFVLLWGAYMILGLVIVKFVVCLYEHRRSETDPEKQPLKAMALPSEDLDIEKANRNKKDGSKDFKINKVHSSEPGVCMLSIEAQPSKHLPIIIEEVDQSQLPLKAMFDDSNQDLEQGKRRQTANIEVQTDTIVTGGPALEMQVSRD